jgi:superfamily II DNA or RNA helicase
MQLRNYQSEMLVRIKEQFAAGNKRVIMQLATGGGKTAMFSAIAQMAVEKGNSVLVITHRRELLGQSGGTLGKFGLKAELLTARTKKIEPGILYVGMVETIKARIEKEGYLEFVKSFKIIVIDEAHIQNFNAIFEMLDQSQYVIGATATPYRDGKMRPLKDDYDVIVPGIQINGLIQEGFLTKAVSYGFTVDLSDVRITGGEFNEKDLQAVYDEDKLYTGAVTQYEKFTAGTKFLAFAPTVLNSIRLAEEFNQAGIATAHIDAGTPDEERRTILADFAANKYKGLVNVGILTTGYDQPDIETIIIYRATKSLPLFLQMCGRGSRPSPGKNKFTIIDFGNNVGRHGFWQADREWSLDIAETKKRKEKEAPPVKECKVCGALIPLNSRVCPECGAEIPMTEKEKKAAALVLLDDSKEAQMDKYRRMSPSRLQAKAEFATVSELEIMREAKGYKQGWVCHKLKTLERFTAYEQLKGYRKGWARLQYERFRQF